MLDKLCSNIDSKFIQYSFETWRNWAITCTFDIDMVSLVNFRNFFFFQNFKHCIDIGTICIIYKAWLNSEEDIFEKTTSLFIFISYIIYFFYKWMAHKTIINGYSTIFLLLFFMPAKHWMQTKLITKIFFSIKIYY